MDSARARRWAGGVRTRYGSMSGARIDGAAAASLRPSISPSSSVRSDASTSQARTDPSPDRPPRRAARKGATEGAPSGDCRRIASPPPSHHGAPRRAPCQAGDSQSDPQPERSRREGGISGGRMGQRSVARSLRQEHRTRRPPARTTRGPAACRGRRRFRFRVKGRPQWVRPDAWVDEYQEFGALAQRFTTAPPW
jgi:hypothetical protein